MQVPSEFEDIYDNFENYPQNLHKLTRGNLHFGSFHAQTNRFHNIEPNLFVDDESKSDVVFREFRESVGPPERINANSDAKLRKWIGDESTVDPETKERLGKIATKEDPKCRFIFLWAEDESTRNPLRITKQMFRRLCTYHQVMPAYLDFISVFGLQIDETTLRISGRAYRDNVVFENPPLVLHDLKRSGLHFQLCYNLQSVFCKTEPETPIEKEEWSIRPAAIYHKFDIRYGTTLWIITKGTLDIQKHVKTLTGMQGEKEHRTFNSAANCFRSSLGVHLMIGQFSATGWRSYIKRYEDLVDEYSDKVYSNPFAVHEIRPENIQQIQGYDNDVTKSIIVLKANCKALNSLKEFYDNLSTSPALKGFFTQACRDGVIAFVAELRDVIEQMETQIKGADLILAVIKDLKTLTLQHYQSQSTIKMEEITESALVLKQYFSKTH